MTRSERVRSFFATVLVVLGAITLMFASTGWWLERNILDTDRFTETADKVLDRQEVQLALSDVIVREINRATDQNLDIIKPFVASIVSQIVDSSPFRRVFDAAVSTAHRALVDRDVPEVVLNLDDTYNDIRRAIRVVSPRTAKDLPDNPNLEVNVLDESQLETVWNAVDLVRDAIFYLSLAAVVLIAGGIALAPRRWHTLAVAGWVTLGSFLFLLLAFAIARRIVLSQVEDPTFRDAASAAWDVVTHGLVVQTIFLLVLAGVIALASGWTGRHGGLAGARDTIVRGWVRVREAIPQPAPAPALQPATAHTAHAAKATKTAKTTRAVKSTRTTKRTPARATAKATTKRAPAPRGTPEVVGAAAGAFMTRVRLPEPRENPRVRHAWRAVGLGAAALIAFLWPQAIVTVVVVVVGLIVLYLAVVEALAAFATRSERAALPAPDAAAS
jgi:hypothetical protein